MNSLNLRNIKTREELKNVLKFLEEQGFGYISEYELHSHKINNIISKQNKLSVSYSKDTLDKRINNLNNYDEIEKEVSDFFSKFNVDDKIDEYINTFYLKSDEECTTPPTSPSAKEIISWVQFRDKFKIKGEYGKYSNFNYYNLDKNYLKIYFGQYKKSVFKNFYNLIFNEECKEFDDKKIGIYQDLGKIEIKFFAKGGANIKGNLEIFKKYYHTNLKSKIYVNIIIKYNNKTEFIKKKEKI
jgi:hypothetical protein